MDDGVYCEQFQRTVELIGSRWTASVLRALLGGIDHFSELRAAIPGLSDRMLAERLRELEREGIVERVVIPETPVRIEYHLTEKGRALAPVMNAFVEWLQRWGDGAPAPLAGGH
ncbi:MAG: winged helix-turn-helix transcriptional regulator [Alkalispirochaeta sp.]